MSSLSNLRVCQRCIGFFSKAVNIAQQTASNGVNGTQNSGMTELGQEEGCCSSCLGIFQEENLNRTCDEVVNKIKAQKYKCSNFVLCLALPNSVVLRQHALKLFLEEHLKVRPSVDIKEEIKSRIRGAVEANTALRHSGQGQLSVDVSWTYSNDDKEWSKVEDLLPKRDYSKKRKHNGQRDNVASIVSKLTTANVANYVDYPPSPAMKDSISCNISTCHDSLFVAGRYNKWDRHLSQTPWFIDGERKTETSVQELICDQIQTAVRADGVKFISSGREDVDVMMLGSGRPFAVELINPREADIENSRICQLQESINTATEKIAVRDLQLVLRDDLSKLKEGEMEKTKSYSAKIWSPDGISDENIQKVNSTTNLTVHQATPLRVLHRRPLLTRDRVIISMHMERLDDVHYKLDLLTEAGTYIKEFVHGDFNRTVPSMCTLLDADVDILELDVTDVKLDWPPKLSLK